MTPTVRSDDNGGVFFFLGVALLANAPERIPEKKKRGREKEALTAESRPLPPVTSGKPSSRAARQRLMAQREEQLAAQKVCIFRKGLLFHSQGSCLKRK